MTVKRIVPDLHMDDADSMRAFYLKLLDLDLVMDQGWIMTFQSAEISRPQLTIASSGGNGAVLPSVSIEVDNVEETYSRAKSIDAMISLDLRDEPWGVRRFFVSDPSGNVLNILQHI